jgi:ABC-type protease/lipase transport system fused ATPase/permease subunit
VYNADSTYIIIALIGLVGTQGAAVLYFGKWFTRSYGNDLRAHTKAAISQTNSNKQLARSVDRNIESNTQILNFMKNLNGKLAKATIQTVKEQTVNEQKVRHQTIES